MRSKLSLLLVLLFLGNLIFKSVFAFSHVSFTQDQARDLLLIEAQIDAGEIIVEYGPKTSVGNFYTPPLYYQLHLLVSRLTDNHPFAMYGVVIFIESLTPVVLFLVLSLFFSRAPALLGSLAYSVFYQVVVYSTSSWSPNLLPFVTIAYLYCFFLFIVKGKTKAIVPGIVFLSAALHFHYQSVILIPFALVVFLKSMKEKTSDLRYWLAGSLLGFLLFVPYLKGEIQTNWQNTQAMISFYTGEHSSYFNRVSKPDYVFTFFPAFMERLIREHNTEYIWLGRVLFYSGFGLLCLQAIKDKKYRWLLFYFISVFIMLRLFRGDKLDYYLMPLFFMPAVLLAVWINTFRRLGIVLFLVIVTFSVRSLVSKSSYNDYQRLQQSVHYIDQMSQGKPVKVVFHELNQANTFAYGFTKFSTIAVDQNSQTMIDICRRKSCLQQLTQCVETADSFEYSSRVKATSGYTFIDERTVGNHTISVVKLKTPPHLGLITTTVYSPQEETDLLLTSIY